MAHHEKRRLLFNTPGYWWRHARELLSDADRAQQDGEWAAIYGADALAKSLRATDWVLDLAYPPPECPWRPEDLRTPAGHPTWWEDQPEIIHAAYGGPRLWEAHGIDAASLAELAQLRLQASMRNALPSGRGTR